MAKLNSIEHARALEAAGKWAGRKGIEIADDLLGEVTISVLDFMEMDSSDYGVLNMNRSVDWWPLKFVQCLATWTNSYVKIKKISLKFFWLLKNSFE